MEKIKLNIQGINLANQKASKEELLTIAEKIFPQDKFNQLSRFENYYSGLSWNHNLEYLFKEIQIEPEIRFDLILEIENPIMRMHQTLYFLQDLTSTGRLEFAYKVVESLKNINSGRTKDTQSLGYRKILEHFALEGNLEKFTKTIKLCEPAKERNDIQRIKSKFVTSYSEKNSLENTLKVVQNKLFGDKFIFPALEPNTKKVSYQKMKDTIETNEVLNQLEHETKVQLLAETFFQSSKNNYNLQDFEEIFQLVFDLDPKVKAGDVKLRDWLLMQIGSNLNEIELVIQCRKAIKNNSLKKELSYVEKRLKENTANNM